MRDELPNKPNEIECGILNLENSYQPGSHWVAWYKNKNKKYYFDSYGVTNPPKELVKYLGKDNLLCNDYQYQKFNDPPICGHLCLQFLEVINNYFFM